MLSDMCKKKEKKREKKTNYIYGCLNLIGLARLGQATCLELEFLVKPHAIVNSTDYQI